MDVKDVINRIKNLQKFEVNVQLPEHFAFTGVIPYDMVITGDTATVTVYAATETEARQRAEEYFNG
jgi:hypothetical protein